MTHDTQPAVLITGAARGIGRAIAEALLPDHRVAITWNTAHTDARTLQDKGAHIIQADFTDPDTPARVIADATTALGPLSGLVNNAGMIAETDLDAFDMAAAETILRVNTLAPLALISAALPHLTTGASVVNITSINARSPAASAIAYSASKAALENATLGLAKHLGPRNIRVNAIAPGAVERDHAPRSDDLKERFLAETALPRLPEDTEIAAAARFLLSPASSGMTGSVMTVSTGFRL